MHSSSFKDKLVYFSPWIFAAACTLLAVIIVFLVKNTYQRETDFKQGALRQQAEAVVRSISMGFRKSLREGTPTYSEGGGGFLSFVQKGIEDATVQAGVSGVYIVSEDGEILSSAIVDTSSRVDFSLASGILKDGIHALRESRFYAREYRAGGERNRYLVLTSFREGRLPRNSMHHNMKNRAAREELRERFEEKRLFLVLDLDLGEFNSSFDPTKKQIFILSFVLLLVISGSCLSFIALRSLSLSQRRLARLGMFQEQLLASLPIGLIAVSNVGKVKLVNRELENIDPDFTKDILGRDEEEISRQFTIDLQHALRNKLRIYTIDEQSKVLSFSKVLVVTDNGHADGYVLLIEDVTQQHDLREELERSSRMASLGKMAAGVAHELRNPLSSVKGLGVLLQSRFEADSSDHKMAGVLIAEVDRLNRSISELLDFAKPKDHLGDLFAIRNCIQKAIDLVAIDIDDMKACLDVALPDETVRVRGDQDKLNQVFLNLLLNSIQAIDQKGKITINYTVQKEKQVVLELQDDGAGIPEEIASTIYDPYFTTKAEGTGLGLAVSTKVVEDHGGSLRVENNKNGGGALARVYLPLAE